MTKLDMLVNPSRPICYGILMPKENVPSGVPYVKVKDIKGGQIDLSSIHRTTPEIAGKFKRSALVPGDLLISIRGTYGRLAIVPEALDGGNITQDTARLAILPSINPKFILYQLYSDEGQNYLKNVARGVAVKGVNIADIRLAPVGVAPRAEQDRIVDSIEEQFTRLDAAVLAMKAVHARIRNYRSAVLKAACEGRLVPTEAELARVDGRDFEPADRLLARVVQERRSRWEADQLAKMTAQGKSPKGEAWRSKYHVPDSPTFQASAELPEGWAWATVEQVTSTVQYGSSQKTDENPEGVPVLRMGNIVNGRLDLDKLKYLPAEHNEFPDLLLDTGDVLFNRTNSAELVGKTAVYRGIPSPCSFASYLIKVRLVDGFLPDLFAYYINSSLGREWVASVVTQQVGQANVNGSKLQALTIPVPPAAEQTRIVAEVERRLSLIDNLEAVVSANLKRAGRLRQSILKRAFEGKLVPQDPADEPASVLLERIRQSKAGRTKGRGQQSLF